MNAKAYKSIEAERPGLARSRKLPRTGVVDSGILVLVDDLAALAAELWVAGKLDRFPLDEEQADVEDE